MMAMVTGDRHHLHVTVLALCDGNGVGRVMEEDQDEEEQQKADRGVHR